MFDQDILFPMLGSCICVITFSSYIKHIGENNQHVGIHMWLYMLTEFCKMEAIVSILVLIPEKHPELNMFANLMVRASADEEKRLAFPIDIDGSW